MIDPKVVAHGSGWRVFRVGRSFCVQFDRAPADPLDVWMRNGGSDMARTTVLGALVSGAYGEIDRGTAIEAMGANWTVPNYGHAG